MSGVPWKRVARPAVRLFVAIVALFVLGLFLSPVPRHAGINDHPEAGFRAMVDGTAGRPFVTRALLPATVRLLERFVPPAARTGLAGAVRRSATAGALFGRLHWNPDDATALALALLLLWLCLIGFAHFTARLTILTTPVADGELNRALLATLALLGLPPFFRYTTFLYDPPQLLFFSAAFLALIRKRPGLFVALFAAATLNKETSLLLLPLWWLHPPVEGARARRRWLAALAGLWLLLTLLLFLIFRDNPGRAIEWHLLDHNASFLARGWSIGGAAAGGLLLFGVGLAWLRKAPFLRAALLTILPPLLVAGLLCGFFDEWRDYLEAWPIVFALLVDSAARLSRSASGDPPPA